VRGFYLSLIYLYTAYLFLQYIYIYILYYISTDIPVQGGRVVHALCCKPSRDASHAVTSVAAGPVCQGRRLHVAPRFRADTQLLGEVLFPRGTLFNSSKTPEPGVSFKRGGGLSCWSPRAKSVFHVKLSR
jgi:hypothetical protein